ncbi:MAG: hypothetical protein ABI877_02840 [Gemmatimonadaceae bacterium]
MCHHKFRTRTAPAAVATRITIVCALANTLAASPSFAQARAQTAARPARHAPVVAVLAFKMSTDSASADTTAIEHGIAALLESELAASGRLRILSHRGATSSARSSDTGAAAASAARSRGASFAVLGDVTRSGDTLRVMARVVRARDTLTRALDEFTATLDQIPALVDDLAYALTDSIIPRKDFTRGGPVFRPPRPPVSFAAVSLYSRAVKARAAGDPDTAVKLLRQATSLAPGWQQPKQELLALKTKS